jgi:outer membrane lipoprotein-sorting protein
MNCNDCKNEMHHLSDESANISLIIALQQHIAACQSCSAEYEEMQTVLSTLQPQIEIKAPLLLKQNIINQLSKNGITMRQDKAKRIQLSPFIKKVLSVAAAAMAIGITLFFFDKNDAAGNTAKAASSFFEMSIKANEMIKNMIIKFSIRTDPKDNFALIGENYNMVEHTIIETFDKPGKWRVEKPGRIVLFDGNNQYLWIPEMKQALKGSKNADFIDWLKILLDPSSILWKEKEDATNKGSKITIKESQGKLFVTIISKAQGNFLNDYLKNKSIAESDNRREYIFDSKTKLLKGLKIYLLENKKETLIFNIENIDYDTAIDPSAFAITLPANVEWKEVNFNVTNENFSNINSKRAAGLIFEALAKKDFNSDKEVWTQYNLVSKKILGNTYGGMQVIKIGEPFKSGIYPGEFVPYEIKLSDGTIKKWKLALRNDNPNKVWMVDGGL